MIPVELILSCIVGLALGLMWGGMHSALIARRFAADRLRDLADQLIGKADQAFDYMRRVTYTDAADLAASAARLLGPDDPLAPGPRA